MQALFYGASTMAQSGELTTDCPVDLILVLDRTAASKAAFEAERQATLVALDQLDPSLLDNHLARLGVVSFDGLGVQTLNALRTPLTKEEARALLDNITYAGSTSTAQTPILPSLVELINEQHQRDTKLVLVYASASNGPQAPQTIVDDLARLLRDAGADIFVATSATDTDARAHLVVNDIAIMIL